MRPEFIEMIIPYLANVILVALLILYRMNKRFKKEEFRGLWGFLDQNIVEIVIGLVLIPDGLGTLIEWIAR